MPLGVIAKAAQRLRNTKMARQPLAPLLLQLWTAPLHAPLSLSQFFALPIHCPSADSANAPYPPGGSRISSGVRFQPGPAGGSELHWETQLLIDQLQSIPGEHTVCD